MSSNDDTQAALNEYYSTGKDPTGGDIGPDDLDDTELAFCDEESTTKPPEEVQESPWAGIDRLEEMVDKKLVEVEAMNKAQPILMEEQAPVPSKKTNLAGAFWQIIIIVFFIVMLILIIKNL